ncbi:MAG: hypothetical protein HY901_34455, partial [Deltaproteobacteria bacterium]|nr:hypothetical protein [Deltaproteobacteria bacterium]
RLRLDNGSEGKAPVMAAMPAGFEEVAEINLQADGVATAERLNKHLVRRANLLGCEPDDPEVQTCAPDALGELLNVAAGVLAGALLGPEKPCRLGIPLVGSPAPGAEPGEVRVVLRVEEEHVLVVAVGAAAGGGA